MAGPQTVRRLNIDGDGQGDLNGHGGEKRAVLVYQLDSYRYWAHEIGRDDLEYGNFGENLTVEGMADDGGLRRRPLPDRQRRVRGHPAARHLFPRRDAPGRPDMPALLVGHHRPGFYMRVITEGVVEAGDEIVKTADGPAPDQRGRHRRAALPARPRPRPPAQGARRPRAQPRLAGIVPRARRRRRGGDAHRRSTEPAWPGFQALRVVGRRRRARPSSRSASRARPAPRCRARGPGSTSRCGFRLSATARAVRTYSLSSAPGSETYRISVKREDHGEVSRWLHANLRVGDTLDVAAPRGDFTLTASATPVVLVSAGVGATPMLAMLHDLAATHSPRRVWWFHAARRPADHAFAREARQLVDALPDAHLHVRYSAATAAELAATGASPGHLDATAFTGLPADADAFLCGPDAFMDAMTAALTAAGIDPAHIHTERFGARRPSTPASSPPSACRPTHPRVHPAPGRSSPSPAAGSACPSTSPTPASSTSPTPATSPPAGPAAPASATPASPRCSRARSPTRPSRPHRCRAPSRRSSSTADVFGATERMRFQPITTLAHAEIEIGDSVVIVEDADRPIWAPRRHPPREPGGQTQRFLYIYVQNVDATIARAVELGATLKRPSAESVLRRP